jgi:hypothetical protein
MEGTPNYAAVMRLVEMLGLSWTGAPEVLYTDCHGERRTFEEASFQDFQKNAAEGAGGRRLFRLEVFPASKDSQLVDAADIEDAISTAPSLGTVYGGRQTPEVFEEPLAAILVSSAACPTEAWHLEGSSADELDDWQLVEPTDIASPSTASAATPDIPEEILLEIERVKAACEAELERHLGEWLLAVDRHQPTYEDWIADVHPENVRETAGARVIDARLYLGDSFHRLLWNRQIVSTGGLDAAERERRYVPVDGAPSTKAEPEATSASRSAGHSIAAAAFVLASPLAAAIAGGSAAGLVATPLAVGMIIATPLAVLASRQRKVTSDEPQVSASVQKQQNQGEFLHDVSTSAALCEI